MSLTEKEVLEQSKSAFRQWEDLWKRNCEKNGKKYREDGHSQKELLFVGAGRALLCIANGPSFEDHIDEIKEKISDKTDIACVDKCAAELIRKGIKPNFVFIADASVSFDVMKGLEDDTEEIILIANVNSNPDWTYGWKGPVFYYVNKDNIQSEKLFSDISGCNEVIPASSNVGNTVVVFSSQVFGYDEYYLIGYDYAWGSDDNYYAHQDSDKRWWMGHYMIIDNIGRMVKTSSNLLFSARWLTDFYTNVARKVGFNMYNLCQKGILAMPQGRVDMVNYPGSTLTAEQKDMILQKTADSTVVQNPQDLNEVLKGKHIMNIIINHVPKTTLDIIGSAS